MEMMEFVKTIIEMPVDKQNAFFESLKKELPEEDCLTVAKYISLFDMFSNAAKYRAIKNAFCDTFCEEIFGHTVEHKKADGYADIPLNLF